MTLGIVLSTLKKWKAHYKQGVPISSGLTPDQKAIKRLEHENAILKEERDILKKAMAIFLSPPKFVFMKKYQDIFSLQKMALMLKVSCSGYYRYVKQPNKRVQNQFDEQVKLLFYKHKKRYGSPRLHRELLKKDLRCSRYQVACSLNKQGLQAVGKKKKLELPFQQIVTTKTCVGRISKLQQEVKNGVQIFPICL